MPLSRGRSSLVYTRSSLRGPSLWLVTLTCVTFTVTFMSTISVLFLAARQKPFSSRHTSVDLWPSQRK